MDIFILIITDLLFVICILLICDYFLLLNKRNNKNKYWLSALLIIFCSLEVNYRVANFFGAIFVLLTVICVISLFYKENYLKIVLISAWLYILVSLIDVIIRVAITIVITLLQLENNKLFSLIEVVVMLIFLFSIAQILKAKSRNGIKSIKVPYLILYTVLTVIDSAALTIMAIVTLDEIAHKNALLYGITFILVAIGILVQLGAVMLLIVSKEAYKEKEEMVHRYLNEQTVHYEYLERREIETKKFRHDLMHHMFVLNQLSDKNSEEYKQYYEAVLEKVDELKSKISVNNSIVDAVLNRFYNESKDKGICFNVDGHMPEICNIEPYDLCTIFSNLLNNAVEASEKTEDKEINVELRYSEEEIIITVSNFYNGILNKKNGEIATTKNNTNMHGWGMQNIRESVRKYYGCLDIEIEQNIFYVTVLLKNIV